MDTVLGKAIYRLFGVAFVVVFGQPKDSGQDQAAEPKEGQSPSAGIAVHRSRKHTSIQIW
jgi:hypothetical protein